MAGPVGAVACLGSGLGAGLTGYAVAEGQVRDSLGRALTGKEYERMAELVERDKEKFWELILLPTAGFGTTAGAIKGAKTLLKPKKLSQNPQKVATDFYRKQVRSEDLKLPPPTRQAEELKKKG